ncbi:msta [Asbolus verrucosus]|uniref:Msta n=1 Tax=Asbolus verrucosus TaxID=1661398 RepID=A0A482VS02_ASBVE|nr:msta [Asbolus verrucosus]
MTRFARAKGSKASNERVPEEATSWNDMKQQLLEKNKQVEEAKKKHEADKQRDKNYKAFLQSVEEEESRNSKWAEFPTEKPEKEKKIEKDSKKSDTKVIKKKKKPLTGDNEGKTINKKSKKVSVKRKLNNAESTEASAVKKVKKSADLSEEELKKIEKKKQKKVRQLEKRKQKKQPKSKDNKIHKRRKHLQDKMYINGKEVDIAYVDGFPIKKEDAERIHQLRKQMISKGLPRSEIKISLKLERRKAEKAFAREKKKVCFNCRKSGHNLSECPDLGQQQLAESAGTGICFKCVSKNEIFGRYMVAAKTIKQGQLILKENPILLCPQLGSPIICFNCCAQLKKLHFCPDCSIAILCNPKCTGHHHDSDECDTFKATSLRREDILTSPEVVTPLRCLLWRRSKKELYERFLQLESHLEARRESQIWRRNRTNVEKVLEKLKCIDEDDLKAEIVQRICGIIDINTFDVRQPQKNRIGLNPGENLRGLYPNAALMAHCCVANVHLAVDDDFVLHIHAAVDIPEGDPVLFNYSNVLQGSEERRRQLEEGKHFQCACARCADPTELGTEMSSLKCPRCHKGLIRPRPWRCSACQHTYDDSLIRLTISECRRRMEEFAEAPDVDTFEKFLKKLALTFHPQHYQVLEIEQNLVRLYTQSVPTAKNLCRKIDLCNKLLGVFKKIEPGISRIQAIAMYELHSALVSLAQKCYASKEIGEEEFLRRLLLAENTLKCSIRFLLYEPINSPEGRLAQSALSELKGLRLSISNLQKEVPEKPKKKNKKNKKKK